ncbi:MAG: carbon storage regulator, partial [Clostridiales bacterium]|nr:carbon storage regulator [Clostridiales bacterium]
MLVLSRKKGEKLIFGENIIVEVLSIDGDRVSIGIDAPREIRVYRKELLDETASINKSATRVPPVSFQNAQPA